MRKFIKILFKALKRSITLCFAINTESSRIIEMINHCVNGKRNKGDITNQENHFDGSFSWDMFRKESRDKVAQSDYTIPIEFNSFTL